MQPISTLTAGDVVRNTAYIYFDFNPPVQTNTVETIIDLPTGIKDPAVTRKRLQIFPNPSSGAVWLHAADDLAEVIVFDILGSIKKRYAIPPVNASEAWRLDLGDLPAGLYFCREHWLTAVWPVAK